MFISNEADAELPAIVVDYPGMMSDSHDRLWMKMQRSLVMLWKRFGRQYDFFYKVCRCLGWR